MKKSTVIRTLVNEALPDPAKFAYLENTSLGTMIAGGRFFEHINEEDGAYIELWLAQLEEV